MFQPAVAFCYHGINWKETGNNERQLRERCMNVAEMSCLDVSSRKLRKIVLLSSYYVWLVVRGCRFSNAFDDDTILDFTIRHDRSPTITYSRETAKIGVHVCTVTWLELFEVFCIYGIC